jgi:hypothetical protein
VANQTITAAARAIAAALGFPDYVTAEGQGPSSTSESDAWRAMPQTRRLMSWLAEHAAAAAINLDRLATAGALAQANGQISSVIDIAARAGRERDKGDLARDAISEILSAGGSATSEN